MNSLKQFGTGALLSLGFIAIIIFLQGMNLSVHMHTIIVGIYLTTILLWIIALIIRGQISSLNKMDLVGDLEDEIDVKKYRKFSDMSLSLQISSTLSIIGMCIAMMVEFEMTLVLTGAAMVLGSFLLSTWMFNILQKMYPERNLPKITEEKYEEKLLAKSDEGEKHVMLHGLYKSYNLVNILLVLAIIATAIYSVITEQSQLFSIFVMGIVIIAVNSRYMFSIRNK